MKHVDEESSRRRAIARVVASSPGDRASSHAWMIAAAVLVVAVVAMVAPPVAALPVVVGSTDAAPGRVEQLELELERAAREWDVEAAARVLAAATDISAADPDRQGRELLQLRVRAGLLVAELLRVELEQTPEPERAARRELGRRIDAAAEEALALLDRLTESSQAQRLRADLLATMIRSDFRAKKYEAALREAIDRALELDPDSPRAMVSAAKPLIFAPPERGRDLDRAVKLLDRALELAPELESARLLRAETFERAGRHDEALAEWRAVLAANPRCRPARCRLERQGSAGD